MAKDNVRRVSNEALVESAFRQIDAGVDPAEAWGTTLYSASKREERLEAGARRHGEKNR